MSLCSVVVDRWRSTSSRRRRRPRRRRASAARRSYFSLAASFFAPVRMVGVGRGRLSARDARRAAQARHRSRRRRGAARARPFRWTGRYHEDMNVRDTLHLDLSVFADFRPKLPDALPRRALRLSRQHRSGAAGVGARPARARPSVVGCDTMNHWIAESRPALEALLHARRHPGHQRRGGAPAQRRAQHRARRARGSSQMGPQRVLIKRGEYGVIQFAGDSVFAVPAFPLEEVFDPTGAGDCFAGGFMGELARSGDTSPARPAPRHRLRQRDGARSWSRTSARAGCWADARGHRAPLSAVRQPDRHRRRVSHATCSVVVPVHNEVDNVDAAARRARRGAGGRSGCAYEIVFVDDGSSDGSFDAPGGAAARATRTSSSSSSAATSARRRRWRPASTQSRGADVVADRRRPAERSGRHPAHARRSADEGYDLVAGWRVDARTRG